MNAKFEEDLLALKLSQMDQFDISGLESVLQQAQGMEGTQLVLTILYDAHSRLGSAYSLQGKNEMALRHLQQALEIARGWGLCQELVFGLVNLAVVYVELRHFEEAAKCIHEAMPVAEMAGFHRQVCVGLVKLGEMYSMSGQKTDAKTYYENAVGWAEKHSDSEMLNMTRKSAMRYLGAYPVAGAVPDATQMETVTTGLWSRLRRLWEKVFGS